MHIDTFINGQRYTVPSQIGIIPERCIYWLHTHDDSGIIHIESPVVKNYTLDSSLIYGIRNSITHKYLIMWLMVKIIITIIR